MFFSRLHSPLSCFVLLHAFSNVQAAAIEPVEENPNVAPLPILGNLLKQEAFCSSYLHIPPHTVTTVTSLTFTATFTTTVYTTIGPSTVGKRDLEEERGLPTLPTIFKPLPFLSAIISSACSKLIPLIAISTTTVTETARSAMETATTTTLTLTITTAKKSTATTSTPIGTVPTPPGNTTTPIGNTPTSTRVPSSSTTVIYSTGPISTPTGICYSSDMTKAPINVLEYAQPHPLGMWEDVYVNYGIVVANLASCCQLCYNEPGCYSFLYQNFDPNFLPTSGTLSGLELGGNYCQIQTASNATNNGAPILATCPNPLEVELEWYSLGLLEEDTIINPTKDFFYAGSGPCATGVELSQAAGLSTP